tara:strand:- start:119 stop:397 length:279 start_codon:yes stop_codon:yes gene_type:complete
MSMLQTRFNLLAQETGAMSESGEGRFSALGGFCLDCLTLLLFHLLFGGRHNPLSDFGLRCECAIAADKMVKGFRKPAYGTTALKKITKIMKT